MGRPTIQVDPEYRFIPKSLREAFKDGLYSEKHLWVVSELTIPLYMEVALGESSPQNVDGYKRLYSKILKRVLGNGYKAFFEQLVKDLIIEAQLSDEGRESYSTKDNLSKRYRLTARYREEVMAGGLSSYPITGWRLLQARDDSFSKSDKRVMDDHPWAELEMHAIQHLHFDEAAAAEWVQDCRERLDFRGELLTERKYASLISGCQTLKRVLNGNGICGGISVKHGRLLTPFTNLTKELRRFILGRNGKPVVEIDMKSAQWVFMLKAMALSKKYNITEGLVQGIRPHIDEPIQILDYFGEYSSNRALAMTILEQDIYSELVLLSQQSAYSIPANWKAPPEQRSSMKSLSFAKILYSYHTGSSDNSFKGLPPSELKLIEVFNETYEEAHAFIAQCARESTARKTSGQISPSRDLSILMQEMEGAFFHGRMLNAIQDYWGGDAGFFMVHDAIFIESDKASVVDQIMQQVLEANLGLQVSLPKMKL